MTILTPKGYSPAKQPESEKPAAPEAPPQPLPADPAEAAASGGQQVQLHFPPQVIGVNCPQCGTPFPAQIFSIVDVGQDPILKNALLGGQLNVASCPRCRAGGQLSTSMLYHDPAHEFLGVYVPQQIPVKDQQKVIGDLSKKLMDGLPNEARRGYMLTPKQFINYQTMLEAILENEGVTREMMDKQKRQLALVEAALLALQDPVGLRRLVAESDDDFDDQFFNVLNLLTESAANSGDMQSVRELYELREQLIELTTWGEKVKRQRAAVAQLKPETTSDDLLNMVVAANDMDVVDALALSARQLVDYTFFEKLTARINAAEAAGNPGEATRLTELRQHLLEAMEQFDELQRAAMQQYSQVLSDVLAANNIEEALLRNAQYIDQNFINLVAANLDQAEKRNATAAVRRLTEVLNLSMELLTADATPEAALLNDLLAAEYPAGTRRLLSENRELVTPEFVQFIDQLLTEVQGEGSEQVLTRLRQVKSQAQMML